MIQGKEPRELLAGQQAVLACCWENLWPCLASILTTVIKKLVPEAAVINCASNHLRSQPVKEKFLFHCNVAPLSSVDNRFQCF